MARGPTEITPVEFELFVKSHLDKQGCILNNFRTEHLENLTGVDGDYVMDVTARFEAFDVNFLVVIECKRYTTKPVERSEVQALQQKKLSVGAHKAMVYTTSRFRSGAVEFAQVHGIALVQLKADETNVLVKSWSPEFPSETILPNDRSFADFVYDGNVPVQVPVVYPSKQAESLAWQLEQYRGQIDYVRALDSRNISHPHLDLAKLRDNISGLELKLADLLNSNA